MKSLFYHVEILEDPRDSRGRKQELINILIVTIYVTLNELTKLLSLMEFI